MKRVALVAGSANTRRELERQLAEYLEGAAELRAYSIDAGAEAPIEADLVLASSELVAGEIAASSLIAPGTPLLVARRTVDCERLDLLVALPPGGRALFVNDRRETAEACIAALAELGLDGVEYVPYYPGAPEPPPEIRIAVTAGEPTLIPPGITERIDIGVRVVDFETIAEILARLGLLERAAGSFSRRYLATIVSLARRLGRSREETRRLNAHLSTVIDSLSQGILVYDPAGRVSVLSENLRGLLGLRGREGPGGDLAALIRSRALLDFLEGPGPEDEGLFRLAEGDVLVRRFATDAGFRIATFRDERDAAAESVKLAREYRKRGYIAKYSFEDIVGESETLQRAKRIARRLARTELSILIHGESGTGKELFASAIHAASPRAAGPFLAVDLGALSDDLIESELFGYEEGAFTGAKRGGKAGLFELADGGTLFLDEIGNVSPKVQKRLLRVLQEKEILRVGGSEIKRVDVRVIAATNEDLLERAARGEFREDLYFRLKMGWLRIPPLRERAEDIPLLVERFLALEGARSLRVAPAVFEALAARDWPGNVRELRNAITYMLAVRESDSIGPGDLPEDGYFAEEPRACGDEGRDEETPVSFTPSSFQADMARRFAGGGFGGGFRGGEASGAFAAAAAAAGFVGAALFAAGLDSGGNADPALESEDRCVLLALAELEASGRHGGREAVSALCSSRGLALGPGAVRARFDHLAARGYVTSTRGRGGTRLTDEGRRLLGTTSNT
ncbi:MAG: sigma 54-interacting transcriptional regulator [Spirochaetaceae bacterium]|nr:sigma 54-interacting transcriptional regulator [Spirochaetaceae bacterium]